MADIYGSVFVTHSSLNKSKCKFFELHDAPVTAIETQYNGAEKFEFVQRSSEPTKSSLYAVFFSECVRYL